MPDPSTGSTDARLVFCVRLGSGGGGGPSGTAQVGIVLYRTVDRRNRFCTALAS
jgi:hypothetical protein